MALFEDIEDQLKHGKKPSSDDDNNRAQRSRRPSEDEIARVLQEKFGRKTMGVPGGVLMDAGDDVHKPIYDKLDGMIESMAYMAEQAGVKPSCVDANGSELQAADVLKCPGGELKTVLKVGWKFAILSHTDDQAKADGPWFEKEISFLNFIKKI